LHFCNRGASNETRAGFDAEVRAKDRDLIFTGV
jgi:hypothetical protein